MDNNLRTRKIVLLTATLGSFITPFMMSAINIALPAIQEEFSADAVLLSWIATSYLLATAVFLVPIGKIADIFGRIKTYKWGIFIFTLVSFFSAFAQSVEMLIVMRIFQGISGAMILTTGIAVLTTVFPAQQRGKALGINVSAVYLGLSTGPFIGGLLTQHLSWRSIFLITFPLGIIVFFLMLKYLKDEWADAREEKLDVIGSLIYAFTLVALVYGSTLLPETEGIILMLCGIPGFAAFVKRQLTVKYPVFEVRLFQENRVFAFSNVAALINYSATTAVAFLLSLYLQYIKEMTPQTAGLILIVQPVIQAVLSPYAGKLSDKKEPALISSAGMTLTALGLFVLTFLGPETNIVLIIAALILLGLGFALFSSPNTNAIMGSVEKKYYGIASASVATMRLLGQMLSLAITTLIFTLLIGKNQISPANYPLFLKSVQIAFIIFTVACSVGIFFSYSRGNLYKKEEN